MARIFRKLAQLLDVDLTSTPPEDGDALTYDADNEVWVPGAGGGGGGGGGAPTDADYLVGTSNGDLDSEIVVGTTPGGELGGTWASPTVDATHSGSSHASVQAAAEATAAGALSAHSADTTGVHGIADTSALVLTGDSRLSDSRTPSGPAGGVLGGTYPNPSFAADMATQSELDAHVNDTSDAHDASAISLADSGGNTSETDVEGAVAELYGLVGAGSVPSYVCVQDQKTQNTPGGTFTSGAWQTRTLNTEVNDADGICSLSSNQVTLAAGTYRVFARAQAVFVNRHQLRLQNVTDGVTLLLGTSENAESGGNASSGDSVLIGEFTIAASKAIELQHRCGSTNATNGFGLPANFGTEVYAVIEFWKVA